MTRLTAVALVVAVASGAALLLGGVATAASPAGSLGPLSLTPAIGTDLDNPTVTTSAGCPHTADSYNVIVTGPNGFNTPVITTNDVGLSFTNPIIAKFGQDMKDAATEQGKTLVAGEYDVNLRCVDGFSGDVKGNFTTTMIFTSPTAYHISTSTTPTTTTTSTTTSTPSATTTTMPSTTAPSTTGPGTTATSTTSDSGTTPSASDIAGGSPPSDPGSGTQSLTPTSTLANTGGWIGLIFLVGLILLAAGLALVLWLQRRRKKSRDSQISSPLIPE